MLLERSLDFASLIPPLAALFVMRYSLAPLFIVGFMVQTAEQSLARAIIKRP
jgi:hypothetical protein